MTFPRLFQSYKIELALNLTKWTIKKTKEIKKNLRKILRKPQPNF